MAQMISLSELLERMSELPEFVGPQLVDVNQTGNYGNSPLHVAATWNDVEAIRVLVENGGNLDAQGEERMTPLHRAAEAGNREAVLVLLQLGADASLLDSGGASPQDLSRRLHRCLDDIFEQFRQSY
ncbi:ankyrin repeat domain-containing protein [Caldimonas mangrovi]|uniref:ankyrin repeat domain-containing protein n=1 Tax=Caldimonas mangrovi TaxID=2944811 RepID=UPI002044C5B8|nr:ankyrin repeat domain-containing protein [Caldimonas mangrovi]